jgi:hypothetical protein
MNTLVLEWVENYGGRSQTRRETIADPSPSLTKSAGSFRIGRDPNQCDLLIHGNDTVSRLHVEIFFHQGRQSFCLRNLAPNNVPLVEGQRVTSPEVLLRQGSTITIGQVTLNVTAVSVEEAISPTIVVSPLHQPQHQRGNAPQLRSTYPPVQQPPAPPQPAYNYHQPPAPPQPGHQHQHQHQQPPAAQASGLECPRCQKVSDYSYLEIGCPWCGTSLAAAVSVLVTPKRR